MAKSKKSPIESKVKEIKRATKRKFSAEEKTRIVIEGLRGEQSISELFHEAGNHIFSLYACLEGNSGFKIKEGERFKLINTSNIPRSI